MRAFHDSERAHTQNLAARPATITVAPPARSEPGAGRLPSPRLTRGSSSGGKEPRGAQVSLGCPRRVRGHACGGRRRLRRPALDRLRGRQAQRLRRLVGLLRLQPPRLRGPAPDRPRDGPAAPRPRRRRRRRAPHRDGGGGGARPRRDLDRRRASPGSATPSSTSAAASSASGAAPGRAGPVGVFVAPGAAGLAIGILAGKAGAPAWPLVAALVVLAAVIALLPTPRLGRHGAGTPEHARSAAALAGAGMAVVALLLVVVGVRALRRSDARAAVEERPRPPRRPHRRRGDRQGGGRPARRPLRLAPRRRDAPWSRPCRCWRSALRRRRPASPASCSST